MMARPIKQLATLIALVGFAAVGMGGCESDGSDPNPDRNDRPRYDPPPSRDPYYDRNDRPRYDDRDRDRPDEPKMRADGIPSSARLVEQGKGVVSFQATRDGRVFVEDTHDLRLLVETQLFEGETISIDPKADAITIDGKALPGGKRTRTLANDHRHRVYFFGERTQKPRDGKFDGGRTGPDRDVKY